MSGLVWTVLCFVGVFLFAALGDLISEEIRGWLDLAPRAILRLAAARLDPELREGIYQDEWLPELIYVLRGAESRPITRLIRGTTFALGLLFAARRIARHRVPAAAKPIADRNRFGRIVVRLGDGKTMEIDTAAAGISWESLRASPGLVTDLVRRVYPVQPRDIKLISILESKPWGGPRHPG
jgi:hypothetical protein